MNGFFLLCMMAVLPLSLSAQWIKQAVDTTASFRGLSVVNEKVVWASGTGGTVIRTVDGGKAWDVIAVPGAEKLDFRDIEAFDANTAFILSIGNGADSRIYKTTDGGKTWKEQFRNADEKAFFDAVACWTAKHCIAMSDPVDGHYVLMDTTDGETWKPIVSNKLPAAKDGEAAFAASGTCLYINPANGDLFLVSGGTDARVFKSTDRGKTWTAATTPIVKGTPGSGVFSIAMADAKNGMIVGGNYEMPDERNNTSAFTESKGDHWSPGARPFGYRSAITFVDKETAIAVGPNGSDISYSRMDSWIKLSDDNLSAVAAKGKTAIWAVGPQGRVFRLLPNAVEPRSLRGSEPPHHYPIIAGLTLSHKEVRSNCASEPPECEKQKIVAVTTSAADWDGPHEYAYIVSGGKVVGDGPDVNWDLTGVVPGTYTITVGFYFPTRGFGWNIWGGTNTQSIRVF